VTISGSSLTSLPAATNRPLNSFSSTRLPPKLTGGVGGRRFLKHQWLYLHSLDSVATIRRLATFYVHECDRVLPHSAFRGQTPDEMYFGTGRRCWES
jgi:hypothetical protein